MSADQIEINEIFGPTFQGEGTAAGQHCLFIRVAQCNLQCHWCDTPFTWAYTREKAQAHQSGKQWTRTEQIHRMPPAQVLNELQLLWDVAERPTIIVVSGGEPMMQQMQLIPVLERLVAWGNRVHIETAGTLRPISAFDDLVTQYNVSPKLASSGNREAKRFKPLVLERFVGDHKAHFKFVVTSPNDFWELDGIVVQLNLPAWRVQVMPEGTTLERNLEVAKEIADEALARGWGLSLRTHVALWGDERGK